MAEAALLDAPVAAFLAAAGVGGWARAPVAGDASGRRYERLHGEGGRTLVLMDSRADPASLGRFLRVGAHLRGLGLAAPATHEADQAAGLALIEDLGPETLAARLARRPGEEAEAYALAADVLARLAAAAPLPGLDALTPMRLAGMLGPLWEHHATGADPRAAAEVAGRLREALEAVAPEPSVLSLRDFHAENLVWREGREGLGRLGLLDYQDAVVAAPEYDLASLLTDARRDVGAEAARGTTRRLAGALGRTEATVRAAAAALGVARNLRILGVFARLAREGGKPGYLRLMPRVWGHLGADLAHPGLGRLAEAVGRAVPAPGGGA